MQRERVLMNLNLASNNDKEVKSHGNDIPEDAVCLTTYRSDVLRVATCLRRVQIRAVAPLSGPTLRRSLFAASPTAAAAPRARLAS
jgi:hypothetical protein